MPARSLLLIGLLLVALTSRSQFPPPAGQPGSTAIPYDSSCFKFWVNSCVVTRGFVNITDTTITYDGKNRASYGSGIDGAGAPDDSVVSLGDGGTALLTFPVTIGNGPGFDFAVFENGLADTFLELGFVEVSSDGQRFVRFPAISNVQDTLQVGTFGSTDATLINNFAGKYRARFGTPFDLDDIKDSTGIDLQRISYVRIVDVVGCIQPAFASFDSQGRTVNDPFPTPFHSCGFDLDAVGVINVGAQGVGNMTGINSVKIYPNPVTDNLTVSCGNADCLVSILTMDGRKVAENIVISRNGSIPVNGLPAGLYICRMVFEDGTTAVRKMVKK